MLRDAEKVAIASGLHLVGGHQVWSCDNDWPHITPFAYDLAKHDAEEELQTLGKVDGYRVAQDWTIDHDIDLWDEADALDADVVRYIEALIREVRACEEVFEIAPTVTHAQRITIVRHVDSFSTADLPALTCEATAALAVMDAPGMMLVDPWPMASERGSAAGKLKGRAQFPELLKLGFQRMVGSRFMWCWSRELSEGLMASYSYATLLAAKRKGELDKVLNASLGEELHGPLPPGLAAIVDLPAPNDIVDE